MAVRGPTQPQSAGLEALDVEFLNTPPRKKSWGQQRKPGAVHIGKLGLASVPAHACNITNLSRRPQVVPSLDLRSYCSVRLPGGLQRQGRGVCRSTRHYRCPRRRRMLLLLPAAAVHL